MVLTLDAEGSQDETAAVRSSTTARPVSGPSALPRDPSIQVAPKLGPSNSIDITYIRLRFGSLGFRFRAYGFEFQALGVWFGA